MKNNKKEEQPSFFKELGCYMKPYNTKYTLSVVLSILSVLSSILSFVFISLIIKDLFSVNTSFSDILINLVLVIVFKILNVLLLNTSTLISHKASYYTLEDIRLSLTNKMIKLPLGYFEKNGSGRLKTLLVDHIEDMEKTLAHMIPELTANLLSPLALIVWMFFIDWRLALIILAWIIIGLSTTSGMMKNYDVKFQGQKNAHKEMTQSIVEYVNGIEVIKNFGRTKDVYNKYQEKVEGHANFNINWMKETQTFSALGMAISPFSLFPVLIFGLLFLKGGSIEASTILMMTILTFAVFGPIMRASGYFDELAGMGVNAKEIKEVLDYKELERGTIEENKKYDIEFSNVYFGYDDENVLNDINFKVEEKETFALVGESGSGKSTIAKLLASFYDSNSGEILIGGIDIKEYSIDYLNKLISYVDQDTFLFDMSIMDNLKLGNPTITNSEIIEIAKICGCHDFIKALPNGYDTLAGEAGNKLSGGEKQRISIVRAMIKNPKIVILDEATAATDPENELEIEKALNAICENKTLIVIAHRLYTVKNFKKIAYVEKGKILKIGTHEELLNTLPQYKKLWEINEGENND